jgi:methylated-DNA-[protein]-cysteine S-methyltransferase
MMKRYHRYYQSPIGVLAIECSDTYLLAVLFADKQILPETSHPILDLAVQQLAEYFAGERQVFELPLGQEGTPFQQKVWALLYQIPFAKTISYQQLSKQYGDVKAIRAIASANGKNNLSIIVPCHRVIGSNQSLTGYAGGLWRKKWLLEHELKYSGQGQPTLF